METHQDPKIRTLRCKEEDCDFTCFTKMTLERHFTQSHDETAESRFWCEKCQEGFKLSSLLKEHEMTVCDASNRPFQCDLCPRRFKLKQALVLHYHQAHKLSAVDARVKVYPGLPVPDWIGKRSKDYVKPGRSRKN